MRLRTERLVLRPMTSGDLPVFAEINADPRVMAHFPAPLDRAASDAAAERIMARMNQRGWGHWAVEVAATGAFIGFTGLNEVTFTAPFTPAVEMAWRLHRDAWGHGYATEAATAAADHAFTVLDLRELVAFTAVDNTRSRAVMDRIGMTHDPADDFDHPSLPIGHRLRRHVLYRLPAERWETRRSTR